MFPNPRLLFLIALKAGEAGGHRPLIARRPQPHVDVIKLALGHRRGHRRDHCLGQPRVIGARCKRSPALGRVYPIGVIDHQHVEVRGRRQPPRPKRAHAEDHRATSRRRAVAGGELIDNHGPERLQNGLGQFCILAAGGRRIDQATQQMHADAKMPLARPTAGAVKAQFIIGLLSQMRV